VEREKHKHTVSDWDLLTITRSTGTPLVRKESGGETHPVIKRRVGRDWECEVQGEELLCEHLFTNRKYGINLSNEKEVLGH